MPQAPESPWNPDLPMMNMGMKYPAGMGIVVARISIQNCAGNGGRDQRAEVIGNGGKSKQGRDRMGVDRSQRRQCPCWP